MTLTEQASRRSPARVAGTVRAASRKNARRSRSGRSWRARDAMSRWRSWRDAADRHRARPRSSSGEAARDQLPAEYMSAAASTSRDCSWRRSRSSRDVAPSTDDDAAASALPVWSFAPRCSAFRTPRHAGRAGETGYDFANAEGSAHECDAVVAFAENGRININDPLSSTGPRRISVAMQYLAEGGYHRLPFDRSSSPRRDGQTSTRRTCHRAIDGGTTTRARTSVRALHRHGGGDEDDIYSALRHYRGRTRLRFARRDLLLGGDDFWRR